MRGSLHLTFLSFSWLGGAALFNFWIRGIREVRDEHSIELFRIEDKAKQVGGDVFILSCSRRKGSKGGSLALGYVPSSRQWMCVKAMGLAKRCHEACSAHSHLFILQARQLALRKHGVGRRLTVCGCGRLTVFAS